MAEKLRDLYALVNPDRIADLTEARVHMYRSAMGNGCDVSEKQMPKPSYDAGRPRGVQYGSSQPSYMVPKGGRYDLAPARIVPFTQDYAFNQPQQPQTAQSLDSRVDMLQEMIIKAKGEQQRWKSLTQ